LVWRWFAEDPDAAIRILENLDLPSLATTEDAYPELGDLIENANIWKKLIRMKCATDKLWKAISDRRPWYVLNNMITIRILNRGCTNVFTASGQA